MITLAESGLTSDQWNYLNTMIEDGIFEVFLYEWLPNLETATTGVTGYNMFDAVVYDDLPYLVTPWRLKANGVLNSDFVAPSSFKTGVQPSMSVDGTDLSVFFVSETGISLSTYDGSSFSAWDEIVTDSDVLFISSPAVDSVHYVTYDAASQNYQFHVATYNGSWSVTDSDIYWGYVINSFASERSGSTDYLYITSDAPGVISTTVVGTTVVKKILPSGGIFGFSYKYGSWSDHFEIDRVDQWSSFRYRSRLNTSKIDDTFWMTCYSSEGTIDNPITGYRVYSSKDGRHWSRGELFPLDDITSEGVILLGVDTTLYALTYNQTYTANRTLWFGNPHPSTYLDLTPYIVRLNVNRSELQQISVTVDNHDNWLLDSVANGLKTAAMTLSTGFVSGTGSVMLQQGIFEVDTVEPVMDIPKQLVDITGRDRLAWLTTRTQSEQFLNWMPQVVGVDEYIDSTGTGYGGLTHTAAVKGSFLASGNVLTLASSNSEGIGYSTYLYDNWNGSVEHWFELSQAANSEYAGLVFRSPDKDNGFFYFYNQSDDKLYLTRRIAGSSTTLWSSSAKSWSSPFSGYFLRVDFRYGQVKLFSSSVSTPGVSGVQWSLEATIEVDGQDAPVDGVLTPLIQSGYVGTFGKGFSDIDSTIDSPGSIGNGDIPYDPYIPADGLYPDPGNVPIPTGDMPTGGIAIASLYPEASWLSSINPTLGTMTWTSRSTGKTGNGGPGYSNPFNPNTFYNFSSAGLEILSNQSSDSGYSWANPQSLTGLYGGGATGTYCAHGSHRVSGWGMACGDNGYRAVTTDGWATHSTLLKTFISFAIAPHDSNVVFGLTAGEVFEGYGSVALYKSTDGGMTFGALPIKYWLGYQWGTVEIPYTRPAAHGGGDNTIARGLVIRVSGSNAFGGTGYTFLVESSDEGVTFPTAIEVSSGSIGSGSVNDIWSYWSDHALSTHTWDGDRMIWQKLTYSPSYYYARVTNDGNATNYADTFMGILSDAIGFNGWPVVGTDDPDVGIWVAYGYLNWAVGYPVCRMTVDNGQTWFGAHDPTWTAQHGCSYFELSLVGFI